MFQTLPAVELRLSPLEPLLELHAAPRIDAHRLDRPWASIALLVAGAALAASAFAFAPQAARAQAAVAIPSGLQQADLVPEEGFVGRDLDPKADVRDAKFRKKTAEEKAATAADGEKSDKMEAMWAAQGVPEAVSGSASRALVQEIEIVGAAPEDVRKARQALKTQVGEPLDAEKQREDLRRLYELGVFKPNIMVDAVEAGPNAVKLRYEVQSNPRVGAISVDGNTRIATKRLISDMPVKPGEVYSIQAQNKIRENIEKSYAEKGYTAASVRVDEAPQADGGVGLSVHVDEGTRMLIKDVEIRGNKNIRSFKLALKMENKGSWGPLKHYYNESRFQQDLDSVKAQYIAKGFLDADARRGEFQYAPDKSWVTPVIEVTEGPRYKVGEIHGHGHTLFTEDEVTAPYKGLEGGFYGAKEVNAAGIKVRNMYGDEGFLSASIEPEPRKDAARGVVDLDIVISEGARAYVGDVKIMAESYPDEEKPNWFRKAYSKVAPNVRDEVVQRQVKLRPGQVYRRFDEVKTRESLQNLSVFDEVKVQDQSAGGCSNVRDAVVQVREGDTGTLLFGVGFGDVEGAFVYANYIEHNLFGMARDMRVSGMFGTRAYSAEVSYLDRYWLGTDTAANFTVFHRNLLRTGDFRQTNTGGTAEFSRPLEECLRDNIRLRLENIGFNSFDTDNTAERRFKNEELKDYVAATIRYRLAHDTRDQIFLASEGHLAAGGVEVGAADGFLAKFEGQYAQYTPVSDSWIFASNTQVGFLPTQASDIGYADRFFMGGPQDLRGFRLFGAGPEMDDVPLGGATKIVSQQEMRYMFTDTLAGVVFADVGVLGRDPLEIGAPRASIGTGVRFKLPVAQVALDLAVPVLKKDGDHTQFFHFNMASTF